MSRNFLVIALLSLPMVSWAASQAGFPLQEGKPFQEQRARILADIGKGEVYSEINQEARTSVVAALDRINGVYRDRPVAELAEAEKLAIFNDQELVNSLLVKAREDSRLICRRERPIGSNRPQNICITVAQRREARESGVTLLQDQRKSQSNEDIN